MSHARVRKHYRVVNREVSSSNSKGTFIKSKDLHFITFVAIGLLVLAFLKGIIIGYCLKRNMN